MVHQGEFMVHKPSRLARRVQYPVYPRQLASIPESSQSVSGNPQHAYKSTLITSEHHS